MIGESLVGAGGYHGRVMMRNDKRGWSCVSPEGLHRAPALLAASRTAVGHGHLR